MHLTQKKKFSTFCIAVLLILLTPLILFIGNVFQKNYAVAENAYLEISAGEFEVNSKVDNEEYCIIYAEYTGDADLPQGLYRPYATKNVDVQTNLGVSAVLEKIQAQGNTKNVAFHFLKTVDEDTKTGVDDAVTKLIIPDGTQFDAHADYSSTYAGIVFKGNTVFERDGDTWKSVVESESTPTGSSVPLNGGDTVRIAWNENLQSLEATIALPYTAEEAVTYTGEVVYSVSGIEYSDTVTAQQNAGEAVLTLIFENSQVLRAGTGISITLSESTLTSEAFGELKLTGEITFYGYSDGEWLTEEYLEIRKTVDEETTVEKLSIDTTVYEFPQATHKAGHSFLGWIYENAIYRAGDEMTISQNTKFLIIEARYLAYSLLDGASVRYGVNAADSGLRFSAILERLSFEENAEFIRTIGIILMPTDQIVEGKEFTLSNYNGDVAVGQAYQNKADISFNASGIFKLNVAIVKMLDGNYNRAFSARAYTIVEYASGADYVWENKIESRSIYEVASNALQDENKESVFTSDQITLLQSYVNSIADISFDGTSVTIISVAQTPVITAASVSINEDGVVTIVVTTTATRFFGVIYNGVRIRGSGQITGEGTVTLSFIAPTV